MPKFTIHLLQSEIIKYIPKEIFFLGILFSLFILPGNAQNHAPDSVNHIYRVNPWISGSIGLVGAITNTLGIERVRDKKPISEEELNRLNQDDFGRINQFAFKHDPERAEDASKASDMTIFSAILLPVTLFLDKEIRHQWLDVSFMYLETQSISANLYSSSFIGPTFIDKFRPRAYYTELPLSARSSGNNRNSFYSGHVSTTATGTFFTAKVYSDFHPQLGAKKLWLYAAALVPPVYVGYKRIQHLSHFPTDTFVGLIVGATTGIVLPQIHKKSKGKLGMSFYYNDNAKGLSMVLKL